MGLVRDPIEVRPYDFQRPHQLSRLQLDALTLLMESYLRVAASFLSTYLRTPVQIQQGHTRQLSYEEFSDSVPTPSVLTIVSQAPHPGSILIQCEPTVALAMIDRALGGPGLGPYMTRELTEIEQTIFRRIVERLLDIFAQSVSSIVSVEPRVEAIEHNLAFAQIAGEGDLMMVMDQNVSLDDCRGGLYWAWPYGSIKPFVEAVVRHSGWSRDGDVDLVKPQPDRMLRHVEQTRLTAEVVLGRTEVTLREFSQLKSGDAVVLQSRSDKPLTLALSNKAKFDVVPGRRRERVAVRVIGKREGDSHV